MSRGQGAGGREQGAGSREQGAQGSEHGAQSTGLRAQGSEHRAQSTGHRAQGSEHGAQSIRRGAESVECKSGRFLITLRFIRNDNLFLLIVEVIRGDLPWQISSYHPFINKLSQKTRKKASYYFKTKIKVRATSISLSFHSGNSLTDILLAIRKPSANIAALLLSVVFVVFPGLRSPGAVEGL
jgi:hypothetical protein